MSTKILFVAYARHKGVRQIGVFKRCLRLMDRLPDHYDLYLLNFGSIPEDPLVDRLRGRVSMISDPVGSSPDDHIARIRAIAPEVIVFGETPLAGKLLHSYRAAVACRIPILCIENYYSDMMRDYISVSYRFIDRWLLIGLESEGRRTVTFDNAVVVPPLLEIPHPVPEPRGVCLLGYDDESFKTGIQLLERLPATVPTTLVVSADRARWIERHLPAERRGTVRCLGSPSDRQLYHAMAAARVVICKNGFQQMVESIYLGTPVVCRPQGGGVPEDLVADYLAPWACYAPPTMGLDRPLEALRRWLDRPPENPWRRHWPDDGDLIQHAARQLARQLESLRIEGPRPRRRRSFHRTTDRATRAIPGHRARNPWPPTRRATVAPPQTHPQRRNAS